MVSSAERPTAQGPSTGERTAAGAGQCYVTEADGRRVRRTGLREDASGGRGQARWSCGQGGGGGADDAVEAHAGGLPARSGWTRSSPSGSARTRWRPIGSTWNVPGPGPGEAASGRSPRVRCVCTSTSLERRGVGARTIRYVHATLRAALEDAVREELLEKERREAGARSRQPRGGAAPADASEEIRLFLQATPEHRLHALLVVIALLGLRRSEVLGLQWEDVDLDAGTPAGASRAAPGRRAAAADGDEDGAIAADDPACPIWSSGAGGITGSARRRSGRSWRERWPDLRLRVHDADRHADRPATTAPRS